MPNKKTAISIEEPLFNEVEALSEEMEVSRSHLFALAVREFIRQHKSKKLLEAINDAFDDSTDPTEERIRTRMKSKERQMVKGQW
jgi:metal-responsive CopG/Arc/MetJ family transcriptional regulator